MTVQRILEKHFTPAGVLGSSSATSLDRDLRHHARLNAVIYTVLMIVLITILVGYTFMVIEDTRDGGRSRTTLLAGAGLTFPVVLEFIRRTVREWSEASLIARLCRGLEPAQRQTVIEKLVEGRK